MIQDVLSSLLYCSAFGQFVLNVVISANVSVIACDDAEIREALCQYIEAASGRPMTRAKFSASGPSVLKFFTPDYLPMNNWKSPCVGFICIIKEKLIKNHVKYFNKLEIAFDGITGAGKYQCMAAAPFQLTWKFLKDGKSTIDIVPNCIMLWQCVPAHLHQFVVAPISFAPGKNKRKYVVSSSSTIWDTIWGHPETVNCNGCQLIHGCKVSSDTTKASSLEVDMEMRICMCDRCPTLVHNYYGYCDNDFLTFLVNIVLEGIDRSQLCFNNGLLNRFEVEGQNLQAITANYVSADDYFRALEMNPAVASLYTKFYRRIDSIERAPAPPPLSN